MQVRYITEDAEAEKALATLLPAKLLALDTETTGLDCHKDKLRLVQLASSPEVVYVLDMFFLSENTKQLLSKVLTTSAIKILQNAKFDIKMLWANGIDIWGTIFDTVLASQLISAGLDVSHDLRSIVKRYLDLDIDKTEQRSDWSKNNLTKKQINYAAEDIGILFPLREKLREKLMCLGLVKAATIEFNCVYAIAEIEYNGVRVNFTEWDKLIPYYTEILEKTKGEFADLLLPPLDRANWYDYNLFGEKYYHINVDSPAQVLEQLERLKIPSPNDPTKLVESTGKDVLKLLDLDEYPVVDKLLQYKQASKRLSGFILRMRDFVHPVTGRIHPTIYQMGAGTGRLSFSNPNLQQQPRTKDFRRCFQPEEGNEFVIADYSQIELRIAAELSRGKRMIDAYQADEDLHNLTASLVNKIPITEVNKLHRQQAKAVNFGLIYGMGAEKFKRYAKTDYGVSLTMEQALEFKINYFLAYPEIKRWHWKHKEPRRYIQTLSGRRRNWEEDAPFSELINSPVQGTSADITKLALGNLHAAFRGTGIKLVLQVHDEIVLECPSAMADMAAEFLSKIMVSAGNEFLNAVPVKADASRGLSWAEKS